MNVSDIGPHPEAPDGHYVVFKGPESMGDDCGDLTVRLNRVNELPIDPPSMRVTEVFGHNGPYLGYCSEWKPSPEEMALVAMGQPIRINVIGLGGLPPMAVWVKELGEV